ncbi:MAG: hypothetical protein WCS76_02525 [Bacilli bacterium]|jgi:hypothetical protein|nr:hypothetical protein [Bacilli bacterium]
MKKDKKYGFYLAENDYMNLWKTKPFCDLLATNADCIVIVSLLARWKTIHNSVKSSDAVGIFDSISRFSML